MSSSCVGCSCVGCSYVGCSCVGCSCVGCSCVGCSWVGWLLQCGHIPVVPNLIIKGLVVFKTVYGFVHLRYMDCLPASGFCLSLICP